MRLRYWLRVEREGLLKQGLAWSITPPARRVSAPEGVVEEAALRLRQYLQRHLVNGGIDLAVTAVVQLPLDHRRAAVHADIGSFVNRES